MNPNLKYQIALTKIKGIGNITAKALIAKFGSAKAIFSSSIKQLLSVKGLGEVTAQLISNANVDELAKETLRSLEKHPDVIPLFFTDKDFPKRISYFDHSPLLLFVGGNADLNPIRTIAIVGTRNCNEYGIYQCERIIEGLREFNVLIISGLAYGIDACVHRKSVELNMPNVAILGSGLDKIYPSAHHQLSKRIKHNGALISQFDFGTSPERNNFPIRNQVVAAMSDAVVVIQSKKSGGSMITAQLANDMNKDVFAIPGRVSDELSEGCNHLIKTNRAHLCTGAKDISYIMRWEPRGKIEAQLKLFEELEPYEKEIVDVLKANENIHIDTLHYKLNTPLSVLSARLLELEFKGILKCLPGNRYYSLV